MFGLNLKKLFKKNTCKNKFSKRQMSIPSPSEIRKQISVMHRCDKCMFLIFDNYWEAIQIDNKKMCPTCGTNTLNKANKIQMLELNH